MAAVRLKCNILCYFFFFGALLVFTTASNDFITYQVDDQTSSKVIKPNDFIPLERERRYVETAIPRLADNYFRQETYPSKSVDKDDIGTFARRRGRMEMIGNLAISSEELEMPSNVERAESKVEATTEKVPEKQPTKKATGTATKKSQEPYPGKTTMVASVADHVEPHEHDVNHTTTIPTVGSTTATLQTTVIDKDASHHDEVKHNDTTEVGHDDGLHHHDINEKTGDAAATQDEYIGVSHGVVTTSDSFTDGDFPKDITNNTLFKNNITLKQEDNHVYYNSSFIVDIATAKKYWVDMDNEKDAIVNKMLSKSHRRAATVKLKFEFPFYGHMVEKVTIATGGFLYTGEYIHSWLAATQYIAPLMANFDTALSEESQVRYTDNGTAFTVEWDQVHLQDKHDAGQFTFQVTLHKNGDIVFVYKDVPILIESIEDCQHPVKVGISDAYIIDKTVFFMRRKTIYEYHRVNFKREEIKNWTVIYMSALPTCLSYTDCKSCVSTDSMFDCKWCAAVNRCSSGYDRFRQEWLIQSCEHTGINTTVGCQAVNVSISSERQHQSNPEYKNSLVNSNSAVHSQAATDTTNTSKTSHLGHSGLLGLLFFILSISGLGLWLLYAYRNPHTASGQVLIKYRPSQWSLRRGEARYTAASIHM